MLSAVLTATLTSACASLPTDYERTETGAFADTAGYVVGGGGLALGCCE